MTSNIWLVAAVWMGLALVASLVSWLTSFEGDVNALRRMLEAGNGDATSG